MRIHITAGTKEQFNHAIPYATCAATALADYYTPILQDACDKEIGTLYLQGLPLQGKNSDNFQAMGNMERAIVNFLRTMNSLRKLKSSPKRKKHPLCIRLYITWFAQEKSTRLE